ncbi:hypothetical protein HHK36_009447 [Tetracentron sinense]|uniref:Protein kinase domain-containing protein n=1 Tax=Tetracentron sinense TaxID=13715 RepID=A0A834ZFI5_TETSI|nr:hypothetical protein HHK36_009447 [Tetracentron sinense]
MESSQIVILRHLFVTVLLLFSVEAIGGDNSSLGYHGTERDALLALKHGFNNHFLNHNWDGLQCYMNDPPRWYGIQCVNGRVTGISLEGIGLHGKVDFHALVNLTELNFLSFKNNWISGNLMDFSSNEKLTHVDVSNNMFDGPISLSLLGLDFLEFLHLQDNKLTGPIPEFSQSSLIEFDVSNNNLSGEIPKTRTLQSFNGSRYVGNQLLCGPPSSSTCNGNDKKHKSLLWPFLIFIFVVLDVIALAVVVFLFFRYFKKVRMLKEKGNDLEVENNKNEQKIESGERRVVAVEERRKLTFMGDGAGFELRDLLKSSAEGLGKGNFGNSYKAILDNGPAVVVKRLRDLRLLSREEFAKQMRVLADQKHPNLMPLLAYYYSKDEKLLVYKFAQNGNLFNRIHGGRGRNRIPFKWNSRLSVARGVARAMEFLHLNTDSQTINPHGNLKSSNVLLDENQVALVSDYGLDSLITHHFASQRMISYKSPEYQQRKKLSRKSDVWSYGNLLLELLSGKISIHSAPQGVNGVDLCSWIHRAVREEWTGEIFDSEISVQRSATGDMLRLLKIALRCCERSPEKRPEMEEVVREVEDIKMKDSEDEDDGSLDPSLTEDSLSTNGSSIG